MSRATTALLAIFLGVLLLAAPARSGEPHASPIVVELYTSQGCNTCPPADAFLGKLAQRKDVIALSFHVNYWDYIGWKDPFASAATTARQRAYGGALRRSFVYTPQMVIGGRFETVGSRQARVERAIAAVRKHRSPDIRISLIRVSADKVKAIIVGTPERYMCDIWVALFDKAHTTRITAGENGGKALTYHNVVRELVRIGRYSGASKELTFSIRGKDGVPRYGAAILVQKQNHGPIVGAAQLVAPQ